jgi:ribosomal protein S18 acetylase RimI-like enzyme
MPEIYYESATADGVDDIGHWLYETGIELFNYVYGSKTLAIERLARQWRYPDGIISHAHAVFAKQDGDIIGIELGYPARESKEIYQKFVALLVEDYRPQELQEVAARAAEVDPMMPSPPDDSYYLQNLVTAPSARGSGAGRALLNRAFEEAKKAGLASVHLDVLTNNPARSFYLANGMRDTLECYVPELTRRIELPGVIRMVKDI